MMTGHTQNQHDPNPVPCYIVAPEFKNRKFINWENLRNDTLGVLSDVAPTILELMALPQPEEMTGHSLLKYLS
jgi:2,3-bisphosphoglycerate-independent phosphoglycerate mutase